MLAIAGKCKLWVGQEDGGEEGVLGQGRQDWVAVGAGDSYAGSKHNQR